MLAGVVVLPFIQRLAGRVAVWDRARLPISLASVVPSLPPYALEAAAFYAGMLVPAGSCGAAGTCPGAGQPACVMTFARHKNNSGQGSGRCDWSRVNYCRCLQASPGTRNDCPGSASFFASKSV